MQLRIYYGDRVHYLCTKATSGEVRKVMNEMAQVVGAMLQRLEVDLAQDEVAVALQAFNLAAWEGSNSHDFLRNQLRKLCLVLKLDPKDVAPSFVAHAKVLATIRRTAVARKYCVDNRVLWSWVLCPAWKAKHASHVALTPSCDFLVRFFLSIGHAQRAEDLKHGRPAYLATKPLLGGLREETPVAERKLVSMHAAHRPVKVVLTYQRYTKLQVLTPTPGFVALPPVDCANADVVVVENVADIDSVRSQHLVWVPFDFNFAFPL